MALYAQAVFSYLFTLYGNHLVFVDNVFSVLHSELWPFDVFSVGIIRITVKFKVNVEIDVNVKFEMFFFRHIFLQWLLELGFLVNERRLPLIRVVDKHLM